MGFNSAPGTVAASQTSDYNNFDDTDPSVDSSAFVQTVNSDGSDVIRSVVPGSGSLQLFLDGSELSMIGNPVITPTDVLFEQQTTVGSLKTQPLVVDNETYFISRAGDQLMSFSFSFDKDGYMTTNYTILSGGIINSPVQMAYLRSWLNTQANYVYIVNADGTMAVLGVSAEQQILGFFKYETKNGDKIKSAWVHNINNDDGTNDDRLFLLVERSNGVQYEVMSSTQLDNDAFIHLHSWCNVTADPASKTFTGLDELKDEDVSVVNSTGIDLGDFTVNSSGTLVIDTEETDIYVGIPYTSTFETMNIDIPLETGSTKGLPMRLVAVQVDVQDTQYFQISEGVRNDSIQDISFRRYDEDLFDSALPSKTGLTELIYIDVWADELADEGAVLSIKITSDRPLPFQVNGITIWLEI